MHPLDIISNMKSSRTKSITGIENYYLKYPMILDKYNVPNN